MLVRMAAIKKSTKNKCLRECREKETRIERDTCTPMFIAALFTIARTWNKLDVHRQMNG